MIKKKVLIINIIILIIISIINIISVNNLVGNMTNDIAKDEVIFTLYRNSVIREGMFYLIIPSIIFVSILVLNKYLNAYSIIRYKNNQSLYKSLVKDILVINVVFFILLNLMFILSIIFKLNISYVNIDFIIYLCTTIVIDILGCTSIFLAIVFINLILNKIITSSIIVFGVLTLIDAFVRVSKMNIMTINKILFYKSDFTNYHNKIFIHLSYIICFLIIGIFIYLLIINKSCSKDILYDEN